MKEGTLIGRMLDQWTALRRREPPLPREPLPPLGAVNVLDQDEARDRPLGLGKLHQPPAYLAALQNTPEALLHRAMARREIADQDRRAGDMASALANEEAARELVRQAMEH